ncbi:uncharacterized protein LOC108705542 [Xenopus laevis]|uniref:Uncharacterized protein LOC108705542 n=1 Tax=Xenopus laevis TaxID=8355 RepID=A0A8J1M827_XENLA|nr:uncharacterized protein LOC108705542 [Xenopus laevis]
MAVFTDSSFTNAVTVNTLLVVEQMVYVSVLMQTVDNYALKVVNLYTSASNRSTDVKYYLLQNGCPNTALGNFLFKTIWNGQFTEARFQMKMAKISGSDVIYLFADLVLCNNSCTPNCNSRSTIDQSYDTTVSMRLQFESRASVSISWTFSEVAINLDLVRFELNKLRFLHEVGFEFTSFAPNTYGNHVTFSSHGVPEYYDIVKCGVGEDYGEDSFTSNPV